LLCGLRQLVVRGIGVIAMGALFPMSTSIAAGDQRLSSQRFIDGFGREVSIAEPPQRIVTIFSSNTEIVAALGLQSRIVGIDALTRYPADILDRPRIGGRLGMSVDAIVAQRPDLVLMTPARQAYQQLAEPLTRLDVPVVVLLSRSLEEVLENIRLVARICGIEQRGVELAAGLNRRLQGVYSERLVKTPLRTVTITGVIGNGMVSIANDRSYTGEAIRAAGTTPALELPGGWTQISPEAVWRADPDLLLFAGDPDQFSELIQRPGWNSMRAVRTGKTLTISRGFFLIPGPRTFDGIEQLAAQLDDLFSATSASSPDQL
jgi:iron complex transport system substrate-binding protein